MTEEMTAEQAADELISIVLNVVKASINGVSVDYSYPITVKEVVDFIQAQREAAVREFTDKLDAENPGRCGYCGVKDYD